MNKKITIVVGIAILVIVALTATYFGQKTKNEKPVLAPVQVTTNSKKTTPASSVSAAADTIEGSVMAISEKDITINVGAPEPEFIGISAKTPVVKLKNNQTETPGGLSDVVSGVKVKVVFKTDAGTKMKVAEKIYVMEK